MQRLPFIDVQDDDLPKLIHELLFSEILCEIRSNDIAYHISKFDTHWFDPTSAPALKQWEERMGRSNEFRNKKEKPTLALAFAAWNKYLTEQGVTEKEQEDGIIVKIWW